MSNTKPEGAEDTGMSVGEMLDNAKVINPAVRRPTGEAMAMWIARHPIYDPMYHAQLVDDLLDPEEGRS